MDAVHNKRLCITVETLGWKHGEQEEGTQNKITSFVSLTCNGL